MDVPSDADRLPDRRPARGEGRTITIKLLGITAEVAIYVVVGLIPLAVVPVGKQILWETPKVALLNILTMVAVAGWLSKALFSRSFEVRRPPLAVPILVYLAVYALASVLSISPVLSIFGIVDRSMGLINMANLVLLYFLVFNILTTRKQQIACLTVILASATLVAVLGVLQYSGVGVFGLSATRGQRVDSTLGNADYATPVLLLAIPVAAALAVKIRRAYALCLLPLLAALLFTLPITGLTGDWVVTNPRGERAVETSDEGSAPATLAKVAIGRVQLRQGLWEAGLKAAVAHPVLGTGPNTYRDMFTLYEPLYYARMLPDYREDKAHNEFIEVAQSTGMVGLATYLWLLGAIGWFLARWIVRNRHNPDVHLVGAIAVGLAGYTTYTVMVFHTIAAYTLFWILLGVGGGLCFADSPRPITLRLPPFVSTGAVIGIWTGVALLALPALRPVFADMSYAKGRGVHFVDMKSAAEAADWYRRAAYWDPYEHSYLRTAGYALTNLRTSRGRDGGNVPGRIEAASYLDRAVAQEPYSAVIYYDRALVYWRSGRSTPEVLADLDTAIRLYPFYVSAYTLRADIEGSRGNFELAVASRQKALDVLPDDTNIMVQMGNDYLQARDYDRAISTFKKAIEAGDRTALPRYLLGSAYEMTGDIQGARKSYEAALALDPNVAGARVALERLRN